MPRCPHTILAIAVSVTTLGWSAASAQDWIIGEDDPNETVVLSTDHLVNGRLLLVNNGSLRVEPGVTLTVAAQIFLLDESDIQLDGATLKFLQNFAYEDGVWAGDNSTFTATDSILHGSGFSFTLGFNGSAHCEFSGVETVEGFPTWGLYDSATATIEGGTITGEFICFGDNQLDITDSDLVLLWLTTPDGATIDTTLPLPGEVASFSIGPDAPWATGIPYTATLTDCTEVFWGLMARSGSSATFHDSQLQVAGTYFERDNQVWIEGLANNAQLSDQTFVWGDVNLRFVNTSVDVWSFYPFGSTELTIDSSIFGEVITGDAAQVTVQNSLCDGTGGYMRADGDSLILMFNAVNLAQTTTSERGMIFAFDSALLGEEIDAIDDSAIFLLNTEHPGTPAAADSAVIYEAMIESVEGFLDEPLSIRGSARLLRGPTSPWEFVSYSVDYGAGNDPQEWMPIVTNITDEVFESELAPWDASDEAAGPYTLRLSVANNLFEPVTVTAGAVLFVPCPGDYNRDGQVNTLDVVDFFDDWAAQDPHADFNGYGAINTLDVLAFLTAWTGGC